MAVSGTEILVLALLIMLSAFFSASEVALISLTETKVRQMVAKRRFGARYIQQLKESPQRMLSAILIGNTVVSIAAASLMTAIMIGVFGEYAVGIATGVMTLLLLIFGEITPKAIAARHSEKVAQAVSPIIWCMLVLLRPVLVVLDWFLNLFLGMLGLEAKKSVVSQDEVRSLVAMAHEGGSIKELEKTLVNNVFDLDHTQAGEIITPKTDIAMIPVNATVGTALRIIAKRKHSRVPVYEGEKDNIVGVLHLRDLLAHDRNMSVRKVMKQPYFVPETKPVSDLLRVFQRRKEHLAIVVDEHGNVVGLVTLEDVLEEIVGEIVDESETGEPNIVPVGKMEWLVRGKTEIGEANERINMRMPEGEYDTLSGFILHRLGHIPKAGEHVAHEQFTLIVQEIKGHRIARVLVRRHAPPAQSPAQHPQHDAHAKKRKK